MRKINIFLILMFIVVLSACSNGGSDEGSEDNIEFNLSHVLDEGSSFHASAEEFAKLVDERTSGQVKIDIFSGGQLGGEVQSIQAAREGNQDFVITGTPALTATAPEFLIFDLPYLFNDLTEANDFLQGSSGDELLSGLSEYGLVGLGFSSSLERNVFSTKPLEKIDDFNNLNIRVVQSDGYIDAYKELGAQPTPMEYSEVYLALQQGVIDAGEGAPESMVTDKFMEVADYYNMTKTHYYPVVLFMSEDSMDKLNEEQQKIVKESAKDAVKVGIEVYENDYDKSLTEMEENGVEIIEPDIESFKRETEGLREEYLSDNPDLSPELSELLED